MFTGRLGKIFQAACKPLGFLYSKKGIEFFAMIKKTKITNLREENTGRSIVLNARPRSAPGVYDGKRIKRPDFLIFCFQNENITIGEKNYE